MQFVQDESWYQVIRITGPAHNLLGIEFHEIVTQSPEVVEMRYPGGQLPPYGLISDEILREVLGGVSEANTLLGTNYRVGRIRYIPTDTPPVEVYHALAKSIVERLARKEAFNSIRRANP